MALAGMRPGWNNRILLTGLTGRPAGSRCLLVGRGAAKHRANGPIE
jgi:hypothetical protein